MLAEPFAYRKMCGQVHHKKVQGQTRVAPGFDIFVYSSHSSKRRSSDGRGTAVSSGEIRQISNFHQGMRFQISRSISSLGINSDNPDSLFVANSILYFRK